MRTFNSRRASSQLAAASTVIVGGFDLGVGPPLAGPPATAGSFLALDPAKWAFVVPGNKIDLTVPPSPAGAIPGIVVTFQAFSFVPGSGVVITNAEAVRVDLLP